LPRPSGRGSEIQNTKYKIVSVETQALRLYTQLQQYLPHQIIYEFFR